MYNFPEKTKLNKLINQKLKVICCTANQVIFEFSNEFRIDVIGWFQHINSSGKIQEGSVPIANLSIFGLLEWEVNDLNIINDKKEMVLFFKNGEALRFVSDRMYESVYIYIGNERIIV